MSLAPAPKKILTRLSSLQKLLSRSPLSSTSRSLAKSSGLQRSRPQTLAAIHLRLSLRGERRQRREGGEGGARVRQRNWGSILQGNIINRGHDPDRRAATRGAGEAWRGVEHAPHGRRVSLPLSPRSRRHSNPAMSPDRALVTRARHAPASAARSCRRTLSSARSPPTRRGRLAPTEWGLPRGWIKGRCCTPCSRRRRRGRAPHGAWCVLWSLDPLHYAPIPHAP